MIKASNIRKLIKESGNNFKSKFRELLGVQTKEYPEGTYPTNVDMNKAQVSTDEFSIRDLAEEFLGREWLGSAHNPKTSQSAMLGIREALNPVLPSAFTDINSFNQTVGGLIEVRILQGYKLPAFISDAVVETQPTRVSGGKIIGVCNTKAPQAYTLPGEEFGSVGMTERWSICQPNLKYAQKLSLARETVLYDLSGELLSSAEGVGRVLGLGKECMVACTVMGLNLAASASQMLPPGYTGNSYIYDGQMSDTPNNTYQATAGTGASAKYNYVNLLATNALVDWKNLQSVRGQLNLQREFETGYPIMNDLKDIIVSPNTEYNARTIVRATSVAPFTSGAAGGVTPSTNFPTNMTFAANPIPSNLGILTSNIWNKLLVDNGFSQANADALWYGGDFKSAFVWREAWPLQVLQANPSSSDMVSNDTVNLWACSIYGRCAVRDRRFVIANGANVDSPS